VTWLNPSYCYAPAARSPLLRACTRMSSLTLFARMREVSVSLIHTGDLRLSSCGRAGSARRRTGSTMGGTSRDPHRTLFLHADTMQLSFNDMSMKATAGTRCGAVGQHNWHHLHAVSSLSAWAAPCTLDGRW
jgi:hypothetical protein